MDIDSSVYQDPEKAQQALEALSPMMMFFYVLIGIAALLLIYAFFKFLAAQRKLTTSGAAARTGGKPKGKGGKAVAPTQAKSGGTDSADYAGLTKEEMKLIFAAEMKRREAAGESITVRNVFEGPLDWEDVDESGSRRVRAEKAPDFEEWFRQQKAAQAEKGGPSTPPSSS